VLSVIRRVLRVLRKVAILSPPSEICRVGIFADGECENLSISKLLIRTNAYSVGLNIDMYVIEQWKQDAFLTAGECLSQQLCRGEVVIFKKASNR
jgi:hypothetical protein